MNNKRNIRTLKREGKKKRFKFILSACLFAALLCIGIAYAAERFIRIKEVVFVGNQYMKDEEIMSLINLRNGASMFGASKKEIYERLKKSSWIKDAFLRKELSGRLLIKVLEAEPIAVLKIDGKSHLIDNNGVFLEEMKDETAMFLPVIRDIDPYSNKETFIEAVKFVNILNEKGLSQAPNVEIYGQRKEDIALKLDTFSIKIGAGELDKKLERLFVIKDEIQRRNLNVEYIDLRFDNKVVIKTVEQQPVNSQKTEKNKKHADRKRKKR